MSKLITGIIIGLFLGFGFMKFFSKPEIREKIVHVPIPVPPPPAAINPEPAKPAPPAVAQKKPIKPKKKPMPLPMPQPSEAKDEQAQANSNYKEEEGKFRIRIMAGMGPIGVDVGSSGGYLNFDQKKGAIGAIGIDSKYSKKGSFNFQIQTNQTFLLGLGWDLNY